MAEELDGIEIPIGADLSDLEKGIDTATRELDKLQKQREKDTVQARKKERAAERKALADKLKDFRSNQSKLSAEQKKAQMMRLSEFRKFESQKISIARDTAKKIGKVQLAEQKKQFAAARKELGKQKIGEGIVQAGAGLFALNQLADGFDVAIEKTKEYETALTGLSAVAKANQETVGASIDQVTAAAKELAKDGTLSINDASQSLKLLLSQGKSLDRAFKLTNAVKQISALENISGDAGQATQDLFKGLITNSADLIENASPSLRGIAKEFGGITAVVEDTTKQQEFFNAVIAKGTGLNASYQDSLNTIEGRQKKFNQTLEQFQVSIGEAIAPIVGEIQGIIGSLIGSFTEWFNTLSDTSKQILVLGSALAVAAPALLAFVGGIGKVITGLKALGATSAFLTATPLGALIAAIGLLTAGLIALNEAFGNTEAEDAAEEYNELADAVDNTANSTKEAADAQKNLNGFLSKQTPLFKSALISARQFTDSLKEQKDVLNEIARIERNFETPQERIDELEDTIILNELIIAEKKEEAQSGPTRRKQGRLRQAAILERQNKVLKEQIKRIEEAAEEQKKLNANISRGTGSVSKTNKEFQDQKTLLQDTAFIEDELFLNRRSLNDQIREANSNIERTLGLQRGVNQSVEKYNEDIDTAFENLAKQLKIQREQEETTDAYRARLVSVLNNQKALVKALDDGKKSNQELVKQAKMLQKQYGGAAKEALEISKALAKSQQVLDDRVLPALGGVRDTINGIKDGDLGGIVEGIGGGISAVNKQVGQIAQGVGQAIGIIGEIFDIQSAEEKLAERRAKIAKQLQKTEEDTIALLRIKESLNQSILEIAQQQRQIALDELAIREQINQTFGEGTVEEREQDLTEKQATLEEITAGTAAEQFDFETREGQLGALDLQVQLKEQLAIAEDARQIIDGLPNLSNIGTKQLVNVSKRLNTLAGQTTPEAARQIKDFTGSIAKIINSRAIRRKLSGQISDLRSQLGAVIGKGGDADQRRRELTKEIEKLESLRRGELERFNERKSDFRTLQSTSAGLGGTIGGLTSDVEAIEQGLGLGQETVELQRGIEQQRGEERISFLQDIVEDAVRNQQATPGQSDQIQGDLVAALSQEITPKLAESSSSLEDLILEVTARVNKQDEGFRKQELEILLDQLKTQQEIEGSTAATAANLDDLTKDRNRGIIDISRGLIRDIGGSFALQDQGVNFGVPEAVSNLSRTLGSVDETKKTIPEQQLEVLKMINESTNRMADFFENAPTSINPNEAEKFLLDLLTRIEFAKVS